MINKSFVITSGGFDPLHNGHVQYLNMASKIADIHVVIVNSDNFLIQKKGYCFMPLEERIEIISALKCVDFAIPAIDADSTVCKTLELLREKFPESPMFFAKGGDRSVTEIPEREICDRLNIGMVDGLGIKINSSSELIRKVNENIGNKPLEK